MMKPLATLAFVTALIVSGNQLMAQNAESTRLRPSFELEYTSELQSDFKRSKWANLLQLRAGLPLTRKFSFDVSSVSSATTDEELLVEDQQGYSNIDAENLPFVLAVAGFTWHLDDLHTLFAGIRRIDEDYFCSDGLSLFTNASCGGFPTITMTNDIAAYPLASMGIHYAFDSEHLGVQTSIYNGIGYKDFSGRNNIFRVCPKSDGVFALAQAEYRHNDSHYFLGTSVHHGYLQEEEEQKVRPTVWAYAEHNLFTDFALIAAYSHAFSSDNPCRNFYALGGKYTFKKAELGMFSDYTRIADIDEWATELTCKIAFTDYLSVQPVLHIITTDSHTKCISMLRLNVLL